ncbi:hypothetical protein A3G55_01535 [Candidatus Giovannonibacteria bacterium RIFCSPLOWO2_12_FULL_44_25]|uniref:bAvd-like domain-containing protein n=3 Tax=Parcubacteria group TaxID=1794811 RepID=A0A1F5W943_9BACT|nr:MAG: hypothetical protein A2120_03370 [Candidatus Giovannonibacteria bacterium GWA2_45_15]OGF59793.1 MAG: hypothetical protein A2W40_01655 [Candidatus Giovannonibacteria bacterium RIFCSPHIGHO2_01_45_12]OGF61001.1 MAG: hypothetical protein A2656_01985 [Candidatus Giovannonibacteria bacterium RIFCSPHIGHO2_01_FULL_44_100]OGF72176.1 MAG: hypothetical protein A3C05_03055 [Candidatus Giovannonibacteria bacterium RIFCSPHIGHO2_02_FULL_45_40]OGF84567.1 MAG: hypothetical protein A3A19_00370 [Candidatu
MFIASLTHKLCELYKFFHECLKTFPKQEKYSLGLKIENTILEIFEYSLSAMYLPKYKKGEKIKMASDKVDFLKYLIRLAYETGSLNAKKYFVLEEKVLELGKIMGGWLKSV